MSRVASTSLGTPSGSGTVGPTGVSADAGNAATLGSDDLIFVPTVQGGGGTDPALIFLLMGA